MFVHSIIKPALGRIMREMQGTCNMRDRKYCIALDNFERRIVVNCLNEVRNKLIGNGKYTDMVDEFLLKIIDDKQKKFKVTNMGA